MTVLQIDFYTQGDQALVSQGDLLNLCSLLALMILIETKGTKEPRVACVILVADLLEALRVGLELLRQAPQTAAAVLLHGLRFLEVPGGLVVGILDALPLPGVGRVQIGEEAL